MEYPLLVMILKNLVIFPFQEIRLDLKDETSKSIFRICNKKYHNRLLVISPDKIQKESLTYEDLPKVGVVALVKNTMELSNGNLRVTLRGEKRVKILNYESFSSTITSANVSDIELPKLEESKKNVVVKKLKNIVDKYVNVVPGVSNSILKTINDTDDLDFLTDVITTFSPLSKSKKKEYMEEINGEKRAYALINDINLEIAYNEIDEKIDESVQSHLEKEQEEYYLKEKLKEIERQLGLKKEPNIEVKEYKERLKKLDVSERTRNKILLEIEKLEKSSEYAPESAIIKNYLDWILNLPWNVSSKENLTVKTVMNSLNKSHYGLEKIKIKIEDYINIKNINNDAPSPILCLVGPPGIGKTTISSSIASSLNREFYKISVGGLNDSTELIGTRRTYLGALPGKIMQGIKKCGTNNPVILIDEIDKMVKDYKGDPASTLLDILDNTQNKVFVDNYIEEPFDLSKVLFILTANNIEDIPYTLLDRLDIIELSSYTSYEKIDIAKKYIIPKINENYNITKKITLKDETLMYIIDNYTKEAGVRNLTRILRTLISRILTHKGSLNISIEDVITYLDKVDLVNNYRKITDTGIVNGLAYTNFGGKILQVECSMYSGIDEIIVSGTLGEVLKESIKVAISFIKEKGYVSSTMFYNQVIHIHLLDCGIKKEGPSCGVAITTALLSKLLDVKLSEDVAFTGEITLKGRILKVGGIKEKVIAAYNNNIKKLYIPEENSKDLFDIPEQILNKMEIKLVNHYDTIYEEIFRKNNID